MKSFLTLALVSLATITCFMFFFSCKKSTPHIPANSFLVDVRTPSEFSGGSVPSAINIPLDEVESQLHKFQNHEHIVVFCRSGNRSGKAKDILEKNGFNNVINGGTWKSVKKSITEQ
jgi:rhodanese-related sulfurtransferase